MNGMKSLTQKQIDDIAQFLADRFSPCFIILFGSAAKGNMRENSDIDIAFLSDREISSYETFVAGQELAEILRRDVDLIDLNKASTVFIAQIVGRGKVIYEKNEYERKMFQIKALKEYALLNEERQCVLDKMRRKGVSHGH